MCARVVGFVGGVVLGGFWGGAFFGWQGVLSAVPVVVGCCILVCFFLWVVWVGGLVGWRDVCFVLLLGGCSWVCLGLRVRLLMWFLVLQFF